VIEKEGMRKYIFQRRAGAAPSAEQGGESKTDLAPSRKKNQET